MNFVTILMQTLDELAEAYENVLSVYKATHKVVAAEIDYSYKLMLITLRSELNKFREVLLESINDYNRLKDVGKLNELYLATHIKSSLDRLVKAQKRVAKILPKEDIIKFLDEDDLRLHESVGKLTIKDIETYYKVNYSIHKKNTK